MNLARESFMTTENSTGQLSGTLSLRYNLPPIEYIKIALNQDEDQRNKLNRITHPEIYKEMWWEAVKCAASGYQYIIMDLPLLFEAGVMVPYMHKVIVVTCEEDLQLQRLMEQRHLSERESKNMIGAQMNLDQKAAMAQYVIENSGSLHDTTEQVGSNYPS